MNFENIKGLQINDLIQAVVKEKCEITITFAPDSAEVKIEPWQPFIYGCPYGQQQPVEQVPKGRENE